MQANPVQQLLKRIVQCASQAEDATWNPEPGEVEAGVRGVLELADELRSATSGADAAVAAGFEPMPGVFWHDQGYGPKSVVTSSPTVTPPAGCKHLFRQVDR